MHSFCNRRQRGSLSTVRNCMVEEGEGDCWQRKRRQVATQRSVFITIWQKVARANRSCTYTEQPPLDFGWSTMYPSGRSYFLSDLPRSQQTQNTTKNFSNTHQPQSDYLKLWKYYEVPHPHVLLIVKGKYLKIKILYHDMSIRSCNTVLCFLWWLLKTHPM